MHSTAVRICFIGALLAVVLGVEGCGGDKSGGPLGSPEEIVGRAPDTTLAAATAKIFVTAPSAEAKGAVDLHRRDGRLAVSAPGHPTPADLVVVAGLGYIKAASDTDYSPLAGALPRVLRGGDPWTDIDLVRGTVHILSNGGGEVEGISTIGYTLTVDPHQAIDTTPAERQGALRDLLGGRTTMFKIGVWIDSRFRLRRIEVPTDFNFQSTTPPTRIDGQTIAADVDYVTFGVPVEPVAPPAIRT